MLTIGSVIDGKYKILNKIGQGGMSVVYLAMNEKANKQWAIKEIRKDGVKDFQVVKQSLIVETDLLKKLDHPNLPSIVDIIEDDNTFLIVMDYVEGRSLEKELEEYGAQRQDKVIEWAKQLCDVLIYLHSRKPPIIYRDLKPENIMLRPDGKVMLIDFGTAREFKERNVSDTVCLGTVGYAAPEQFGGQGQTDARTDIYGLGATLFHLLTGQSPCEPPYEMRPIREIRPELSSGLEKIILKCVEKDPAQRYQSCEELLYDIENYDKFDDMYRKKQKRRLFAFSLTLVLSAAFLTSGLVLDHMANSKRNNNYAHLIEEEKQTADITQKMDICQTAIEIKPADKTAYLELILAMKSDSEYSVDEEQLLVNIINKNEEELKKAPATYVEICFETGKLYWYYYSYGKNSSGDEDSNKIIRMRSARSWFDNAAKYSDKTFSKYNMALIYRDIGNFYAQIDQLRTEANDSGEYKTLFKNYQSLLKLIKSGDEAEIVQLELYNAILNSVEQYGDKFASDGVKKDDILSAVEQIEQSLDDISESSEKLTSLKLETKKAVKVAKKTKITTAYADNNSDNSDDTNKTDETEKAVDKE